MNCLFLIQTDVKNYFSDKIPNPQSRSLLLFFFYQDGSNPNGPYKTSNYPKIQIIHVHLTFLIQGKVQKSITIQVFTLQKLKLSKFYCNDNRWHLLAITIWAVAVIFLFILTQNYRVLVEMGTSYHGQVVGFHDFFGSGNHKHCFELSL